MRDLESEEAFSLALLGRVPSKVCKHVQDFYLGTTVAVTGAGGSIGIVVALKLLEAGAGRVILLDNCEFNLYTAGQILKAYTSRVVSLLCDVCDEARLSLVLGTYKVDHVIHAAAYKHVPIVERNPFEGFRVNLFGTMTVLKCCKKYGVKSVTLVSTDKAVNPTNLMGASKRVAEDVVLGGSLEGMSRKAVRFGNVLGSSGSVVPLFKAQLLSGVPVTLTHKEVTRYFMSIGEAVELLLGASTLPENGVYVLDMGTPISILDLITRLATELKVKEYSVVEIGLRHGEKMYEELTLGTGLTPTKIARVMFASGETRKVSYQDTMYIKRLSDTNDVAGLRKFLQDLGLGYSPDSYVVDSVWLEKVVSTVDVAVGDPNSWDWVAEYI